MIETITRCDICDYEVGGPFNTDILRFACHGCGEEYCVRCSEKSSTCSGCGGLYCGACMVDTLCEYCNDEEEDLT